MARRPHSAARLLRRAVAMTSNRGIIRRARQFWHSWWHLYRNGDYVKDFVKYEPLRGWRRVRMAHRVWRVFGYGKDFHLGDERV